MDRGFPKHEWLMFQRPCFEKTLRKQWLYAITAKKAMTDRSLNHGELKLMLEASSGTTWSITGF